jgi:hypothetical protein
LALASFFITAVFIFNYALQPFKVFLCDLGWTFQPSQPGVSTRDTTQDHPAAEGGTVGEKGPGILPKYRFPRYI